MNPNFDDPKFTAYALGELEPEEHAAVESILAQSEDARNEIATIQQVTEQICHELQTEPCPHLTAAQRRWLFEPMATRPERIAGQPEIAKRRPWSTVWAYVGFTAAAACLVLGILIPALDHRNSEPPSGTAATATDHAMSPGSTSDISPVAVSRRPGAASQPSRRELPKPAPSNTDPPPAEVALAGGNTRPLAVPTVELTSSEPRPAPISGTPLRLAPLALTLPLPAFVGTPVDVIITPHMEMPSDHPRPAFLAPAGITNVALGRPVTCSDRNPVAGSPALVTDGDKEATDTSFLEMHRKLQWVQIDLGELWDIYAIVIWHDHHTPQVYFDVVIQLADDADFTQNVRTLFNNDWDNSTGLGLGTDKEYWESYEGRLVDAKGARARFVRSYSRGSSFSALNRCSEIEVFALPATGAAPTPGTQQITPGAPDPTTPQNPTPPTSKAPLPLKLPAPAFSESLPIKPCRAPRTARDKIA